MISSSISLNRPITQRSNLYQTYEGICLKRKISAISQEKLSDLSETAKKMSPGTFEISSYSPPIIVGKSKENRTQIGIKESSLGKGCFGKVGSFLLLEENNPTNHLEKIAIKLSLDPSTDTGEIANEIAILTDLHKETNHIPGIQSPPLAIIHDTPSTNDSLPIGYATELFPQDYKKYMKKAAPSFPTVLSHFLQLSQGLAYLQEKGILHSDIKERNVLIKKNRTVLADFGSAKNTKLGQNPDPETYPYAITPFKAYQDLCSKDYTNAIQREEGIQTALGIDRYQLGVLFYTIFTWLSSGYQRKEQGPYGLDKILIEGENRYYPKHFASFSEDFQIDLSPFDFPCEASLTNTKQFIKEMVAVYETERPSMKKIEKLFTMAQGNLQAYSRSSNLKKK